MSVVATVNKPDQFLVQINGSVRMIADEVTVTVSGELAAGTILESATAVVDAESTEVFGILAEDKPEGTAVVRVITRGNPTSVNAQDLGYGTGVVATIDGLLAEKDIIVVNK